MSELNISHKVVSGVSVGGVEGRLDLQGAGVVEAYAEQRFNAGESRLVLNLAGVDYISSAGLRAILAATKRLKEKQGRLHLASLKSVVREVFDISGFSSIIPIFESVDAAISGLK